MSHFSLDKWHKIGYFLLYNGATLLPTTSKASQTRAKQCPPDGDWRIWLLLAGRGFGKTRTGAEWLSYLARHCPDLSLAIVGATFDDARYVMVEGPSGILAASDFYGAPDWALSKRLLRWSNGTVARLYAVEAPRLRGFRKMRAALHRHDFEEAATEAQDSKWAHQTGHRATHITALLRRAAQQ